MSMKKMLSVIISLSLNIFEMEASPKTIGSTATEQQKQQQQQ
jgi:hypothetical protein